MAEEVLLVNPRRRRAKRRATTARKRRTTTARRNPAPRRRRRAPASRRRVRRVRRNPAPRGMMGKVNQSMMPAIQGAGGALGLDLMLGYLPLPAGLSDGMGRHLLKGVGAVAMGYLAGMVVKPKTAQSMMQGALTVTLHEAGRDLVQQTMPQIKLGYGGSGYVVDNDLSAYLDEMNSSPKQIPDMSTTQMGAYLDESDEMDYMT